MIEDLAALSARFMEAVRDRELPFLEYRLGEEFTLTTGRAASPVRRRAEWLHVTASRYEIEEFAFEELEALDYGSVGVVRSRYRQNGSMDDERRDTVYLMTDVWVERDGRAQLVTRHVSPL
jgi:Domain of unknown function (DUF4440)